MKKTHFLIRIHYQRIVGPYTPQELHKAFKQMEFGGQDEVAGSLGPWIPWEDKKSLKKYYPELFPAKKEDPGTFHMSLESDHKLKKSKKRNLFPLMASLVILLLIVGGGVLFHKRKEQILKFFASSESLSTKTALNLLRQAKEQDFERYMDQNLKEILGKGYPKEWLPLLRVYAFLKDGDIKGVNPRLIRGRPQAEAPKDCRLSELISLIQRPTPSLSELVFGETLQIDPLLQLLLFDPYWIKRRRQPNQWLSLGSFQEACILMLEKALEKSKSSLNSKDQPAIRTMQNRVAWMNSIFKETTQQEDIFEMDGPLWQLSCFEAAQSQEDFTQCASEPVELEWEAYLKKRGELLQIMNLSNNNSILSQRQLDEIADFLKTAKPIDTKTQLDYGAELRFFQELIINNGQVTPAKDSILSRFPSLNSL